MGGDDDFAKLIERVVAGDKKAFEELYDRYGPVIRKAVRSRLNPDLRSIYDTQDFEQDVWASFVASPASADVAGPEDLAGWLAQMARNKVVDETRKRLRGMKHNLNREHSLDSSVVAGQEEHLVAQQPSPSQVATGREEWERFLDAQPLVYRGILLLLSEGYGPAEIAVQLGLNERTVYRVIARYVERTK